MPLFNLWTLRWAAAHPIPVGDAFWNAPIFHPARGTFAFSEPQPLTAVVFGVLRHIDGDVVGMSLVLLLAITLNGVAGYVVARRLHAGRAPAVLVGVLVQALPFVIDQFGVLQLVVLAPALFAIAAVVAWWEQPRLRYGVELGCAGAAALLVCGNTALLFALAGLGVVPLAAVWLARHREGLAERAGSLAVAVGIVVVVAGPVVIGQEQRLQARSWLDTTVIGGSATWDQWGPGGRSWPGWILVGLAVAGAWIGRDRVAIHWLAGLAVAGFALSFGLRMHVFGWRPWSTLTDVVPGLDRLRSPWRATVVTQAALALLAAPVLDRLWQWSLPSARAFAVVAVGISVGVGSLGPGELYALPSAASASSSAAARWLAATSDRDAVAVLPFAPGPSAADFQPTALAMLASLDHHHPLVNGYSGFFPPDHGELRRDLAGFPDDASLAALAARDTTYVLADAAWLDPRLGALATWGIAVVVDDPSGVLLRLPVEEAA